MNFKRYDILRGLMKRIFIDGLNGMALGFFSTLIVGIIIKQIGLLFGDNWLGHIMISFGTIATVITGGAIGVGVAYSLSSSKLVVFSSAVTGFIGANASTFALGKLISEAEQVILTGPGDPLSAFIAAIVGVEFAKFIAGKTKVDIILTPIVTIITGGVVGILIGPPISSAMRWLGDIIMISTNLQPLLMGVLVSTLMGMALTLPISSAALAIVLGLSGIAGGAATVGCSAQMIGFAVASFRENKLNGLIAQGVGTSMLQVPNIIKNPKIWIPPTVTSAILGPVATVVFYMNNTPEGSGMGTAGFVGQIMTWNTMIDYTPPLILFIKIAVCHFILPATLTLVISEFMRKRGWIKFGDMKLNI